MILGIYRFKEAQAFWPRIREIGSDDWAVHAIASKRPRPFGPGYHLRDRHPNAYIATASKRPRPFGPGYMPLIDEVLQDGNGLQRGPGLLAQDTRLAFVCLVWGSKCFKEAQAFWPRIHIGQSPLQSGHIHASKRPRPFGPGYLIRTVRVLHLVDASKRPRPFGPGYILTFTFTESELCVLQRGPGLLAQDTCHPAATG